MHLPCRHDGYIWQICIVLLLPTCMSKELKRRSSQNVIPLFERNRIVLIHTSILVDRHAMILFCFQGPSAFLCCAFFLFLFGNIKNRRTKNLFIVAHTEILFQYVLVLIISCRDYQKQYSPCGKQVYFPHHAFRSPIE